MTDGPLRLSPLHERHAALGAKFGEFGGWSMPLQYSGVIEEHTAVREAVGLFDVSHLGKATVSGPGAAAYVDATLSNDLGKVAPGRAQYTLCLDDATGGVVDDLIAYYRSDDEVFLVPNAANTAEVVRRLAAEAPAGIAVTDRHEEYAVLAVQGPRSDELLSAAGFPVGHGYMSFADAAFEDEHVTVCRTGYTGERGYELVAPAAVAVALWDALTSAGEPLGLVPCGLGARDTLRTEMGYPLHGQDISLAVTPNEAGLGWAVGWSKPAFWGRDRLVAERAAGPARALRGLVSTGRGIPRAHMTVLGPDGAAVGEITSGTFSPTLKKGVGLALVDAGLAADAEVGVDVRGRLETFRLTAPPFVPSHVR
jgi:aminomethyltransferase